MSTTTQVGTESETRGQYKAKAYSAASASSPLAPTTILRREPGQRDVHQYFAESNAQTRHELISALDIIESLNPHAVIAGHKRPANEDSPRIIEQTRQYIRDFDRIAEATTTALELYDQMLKLYPRFVLRSYYGLFVVVCITEFNLIHILLFCI